MVVDIDIGGVRQGINELLQVVYTKPLGESERRNWSSKRQHMHLKHYALNYIGRQKYSLILSN